MATAGNITNRGVLLFNALLQAQLHAQVAAAGVWDNCAPCVGEARNLAVAAQHAAELRRCLFFADLLSGLWLDETMHAAVRRT
jgi:hypothetical protein